MKEGIFACHLPLALHPFTLASLALALDSLAFAPPRPFWPLPAFAMLALTLLKTIKTIEIGKISKIEKISKTGKIGKINKIVESGKIGKINKTAKMAISLSIFF